MGIYGLQLRKGGDLFVIDWDSDREDYSEKIIGPDDYVFFTNEYLCLDKNITLRDLFLLMNKHMEYFSVISAYSFLRELIQEALMEPEELTEDINFLELRRVAVIDNDDECLEEQNNYLFKNFEFSGVGPNDRFGLELLPLSSIITLPLFFNEKVEIQQDEKTVFTYYEKFTLYDVINGILEELAYAGTEEDREILRTKIKAAIKEADEGEAVSFEDLKKEMEEKAEKNKVPCIYCGKESRSPHFNKPEKICISCFKNSTNN